MSTALPSHEVSRTQASHWSHVTGVTDIANARAIVTLFCGSFSRRSGSSGGDPIVNLPGGTTFISGQLRHSLKVCPGFGGVAATAGAHGHDSTISAPIARLA